MKNNIVFLHYILTHFFLYFSTKDDIDLFDYNVEERVNDFVETAMAQVGIYFYFTLFPWDYDPIPQANQTWRCVP